MGKVSLQLKIYKIKDGYIIIEANTPQNRFECVCVCHL